MGQLKLFSWVLIAGISGTLLTACSSGSDEPASYNGNLSQASITADNGADLAGAVVDGASGGSSSVANASSGSEENREQLLGLSHDLGSAVKKMDLVEYNSSPASAAIQSSSSTITSPCGGSFSYSYTYDDVTGEFSIVTSFSGYTDCDDNSVLNGTFSMKASGQSYDSSAAEYYYASASMEFNTLTYSEGSESITMTGSIVMTMASATSYTTTMNFDFRDNTANKTYRLENYKVVITEDSTGVNMDISGKTYHPEHGYVNITTTTLIRANFADNYPSAGVIELTGAGASKARVSFTSNNTYKIDIDSNGDSTYETTRSCTWTPNVCD